MKTFADIKVDEAVRILIFGEPGVGKTSLASTWPGLAIADVDNNLHVLKSKDYRERFGTPDLVGYQTFQDSIDPKTGAPIASNAHIDLIHFLNECADNDQVKTIVLDSLTSIQSNAMNLAIEHTGKTKKSKTKAGLSNNPILVPTQADYGAEMAAFSQLMDQLAALGKTIICLAHERTEETSNGLILKRSPQLIGSSVRSSVGRWFQEVWYLEALTGRSNTRKLRTQSTNQILGLKSAAFSLPDGMEDPSYDKIMKEVNMQSS